MDKKRLSRKTRNVIGKNKGITLTYRRLSFPFTNHSATFEFISARRAILNSRLLHLSPRRASPFQGGAFVKVILPNRDVGRDNLGVSDRWLGTAKSNVLSKSLKTNCAVVMQRLAPCCDYTPQSGIAARVRKWSRSGKTSCSGTSAPRVVVPR
jgi:hypothetical protein